MASGPYGVRYIYPATVLPLSPATVDAALMEPVASRIFSAWAVKPPYMSAEGRERRRRVLCKGSSPFLWRPSLAVIEGGKASHRSATNTRARAPGGAGGIGNRQRRTPTLDAEAACPQVTRR